ncbi:MAG: MetS family NSS transporter small subunit, partial [Micrococcales bacterium]|nr:MetS family NSS transporter small subunit [Micrococcales bacterium]
MTVTAIFWLVVSLVVVPGGLIASTIFLARKP